jgi:hypothetical protein
MSIFVLDQAKEPRLPRVNVPTMKFDSARQFIKIAGTPLGKCVYFHAKRQTEDTIDSFAIVDEAFVREHFPNDPVLKENFGRGFKGEKLFIVFFQITIAKQHVVDGSVLRKLQKEACDALGLPKLPMIFVFISWPGGITKRQNVTRLDGSKRIPFEDQDQFGPQYVLQLRGKFDEIAALLA